MKTHTYAVELIKRKSSKRFAYLVNKLWIDIGLELNSVGWKKCMPCCTRWYSHTYIILINQILLHWIQPPIGTLRHRELLEGIAWQVWRFLIRMRRHLCSSTDHCQWLNNAQSNLLNSWEGVTLPVLFSPSVHEFITFHSLSAMGHTPVNPSSGHLAAASKGWDLGRYQGTSGVTAPSALTGQDLHLKYLPLVSLCVFFS